MLACTTWWGYGLKIVSTTDVEDRLIGATLTELSRHGYRGATTRAIAARAGVNEVTLFRRFGAKAELGRRALIEATSVLRESVGAATDDVVADLRGIATGFLTFVDGHPGLLARALPEILGGSELADIAVPLQTEMAARIIGVFDHHRRASRLIDQAPEDLAKAFLGPIAARSLLAHILPPAPFDVDAHVDAYLYGHGGAEMRRTR